MAGYTGAEKYCEDIIKVAFILQLISLIQGNNDEA